MVNLVDRVIDSGAPEFAVTGICSIERITPGQIRVTYFSRRKEGDIVVGHVVWDYQLWLRAQRMIRDACEIIEAEPFPFCELVYDRHAN